MSILSSSKQNQVIGSFDSGSFVRHHRNSHRHPLSSSNNASSSANDTTSAAHHYWFSLICNKAKQVGLAIMNLNSSVVLLSEYVDDANYSVTRNMIETYQPKKLLLPRTLMNSRLVESIKRGNGSSSSTNQASSGLSDHDISSSSSIQYLGRNLWNEVKGHAYLESFTTTELLASLKGEILNKYLCVASFSALIVYVEHNQQVAFVPSSLTIKYQSAEGFMMLDSSAIKNLELLCNLQDGTARHSIFSLLNYTLTPMGTRLLRMSLLQPLTNIDTINKRQEAIEEILEDEEEYYSCRNLLQSFCFDMEHMMSGFSSENKERKNKSSSAPSDPAKASKLILNIIALKICLQCLADLAPALAKFQSPLLVELREKLTLDSHRQLMKDIEKHIDDNVVIGKSQDMNQCNTCFALRPGIHEFLDTTREVYTEIHESIYTLLEETKKKSGLETLKIMHSSKRGFYLSVDNSESIPSEYANLFIQKYSYKKHTTFSSLELNSLNTRLKEITEDIVQLTAQALQPLISVVRQHLGWLVSVTESIATLDVLFSLASVVCSAPLLNGVDKAWNKPLFTEKGPIAVKQAKHPLLTSSLGQHAVVPNDFFLSPTQNFVIITGANMSGKTVALKTLGVIQILGQLGCPVPAKYCSLRCMKQIFTRISTDDSLETHSSSFMVEMREMAVIVQNAHEDSLILIDELGRATSNSDALAISFAISEYILCLGAFTCFVTHLPELTELENIYPNVRNIHTAARIPEDEERIDYLFQLRDGSCDLDAYGLKLASIIKLPAPVLKEAIKIRERIQQEIQRSRRGNSRINMLRKLCSRVETLSLTGVGTSAWQHAAKRLQAQIKRRELQLLGE